MQIDFRRSHVPRRPGPGLDNRLNVMIIAGKDFKKPFFTKKGQIWRFCGYRVKAGVSTRIDNFLKGTEYEKAANGFGIAGRYRTARGRVQ